MLKVLKRLWHRGDLVGLAGTVAIAIALFYFAQSVVYNLLAPAISVFIGDPVFEANAFVINLSEFRYGLVIEAALTLGLTTAAVLVAARRFPGDPQGGDESRACPECTKDVPIMAKRCPYCTARIQVTDK